MADPFTPQWWVERLYSQLHARQWAIARLDAYYRGDHPLPWLPPQAEVAFQRILKMTRTNYMGLVVDALVERMQVLGFRVRGAPEDEAWAIWQTNNLDSGSGEAFLEAAKSGSSYMLVSPGEMVPRVTVEHPASVIVAYEPGDVRRRSAALKVWADDALGLTQATLYLPEAAYKFAGPLRSPPAQWRRRVVPGEDFPLLNPLGVVPIVELRNNAGWQLSERAGSFTLLYGGVSEIADVTDIQDRINKTVADRLMTQDFGAFPQRWATGWPDDQDEEIDPLTGRAVAPVDIGRDRLITAPKGVAFGQFDAAPLDPYSNAKQEDVKDIASRTRTPSQYLLGEIVNVSGDALQAAESGLTSKARQRQQGFDDGLEEVVALYLRAAGHDGDVSVETIWRDPQYRTLAQLTDAVIKRYQSGLISWQQAVEDLGYTPEQIDRNRDQLAQELAVGVVSRGPSH